MPNKIINCTYYIIIERANIISFIVFIQNNAIIVAY